MRFAVIAGTQDGILTKGTYVDQILIARQDQQTEMEAMLGMPCIVATPLGLAMGDTYNGENWTRNVDGMQEVLPIHKEE